MRDCITEIDTDIRIHRARNLAYVTKKKKKKKY